MAKPLTVRIESTALKLSQLKARQRLSEQAAKARERRAERRAQAKTLAGLLRSADAHRKIILGGVVIAAGADDLDPAELCGWLLAVMAQRAEHSERVEPMREAGLQRFECRRLGHAAT
jgi:hypothetical protein